MSTISVPLSESQEAFISSYIKSGKADNKAQVVRQALNKFAEDEAVRVVLEAAREIGEGKGLTGDLKTLLKQL